MPKFSPTTCAQAGGGVLGIVGAWTQVSAFLESTRNWSGDHPFQFILLIAAAILLLAPFWDRLLAWTGTYFPVYVERKLKTWFTDGGWTFTSQPTALKDEKWRMEIAHTIEPTKPVTIRWVSSEPSRVEMFRAAALPQEFENCRRDPNRAMPNWIAISPSRGSHRLRFRGSHNLVSRRHSRRVSSKSCEIEGVWHLD